MTSPAEKEGETTAEVGDDAVVENGVHKSQNPQDSAKQEEWTVVNGGEKKRDVKKKKEVKVQKPKSNALSPPEMVLPDFVNSSSPVAPMYITIGPQCCGKTTLLKSLFAQNFTVPTTHHIMNTFGLNLGMGMDITLDDQEGVYLSLDARFFLSPQDMPRRVANHTIHGRSILERVTCPSQMELRLVLSRLYGKIDANMFRTQLANMSSTSFSTKSNNNVAKSHVAPLSKSLRTDLIQAVEWVRAKVVLANQKSARVAQPIPPAAAAGKNGVGSSLHQPRAPSVAVLPRRVDLYTVEGIFCPNGALAKAQSKLQFAAMGNFSIPTEARSVSGKKVEDSKPASPDTKSSAEEGMNTADASSASQETTNTTETATEAARRGRAVPVAWGNTNTRPREYQIALDAAERSGRPVQFVPYIPVQNTTTFPYHVQDQPYIVDVGIKELLRRNVERLCRKGRYVNSNAIVDALDRTRDLISAAQAEMAASLHVAHGINNMTNQYYNTTSPVPMATIIGETTPMKKDASDELSADSATGVAVRDTPTPPPPPPAESPPVPVQQQQQQQLPTQPQHIQPQYYYHQQPNLLSLDAALAQLAGFTMDPYNNTVRRVGKPRELRSRTPPRRPPTKTATGRGRQVPPRGRGRVTMPGRGQQHGRGQEGTTGLGRALMAGRGQEGIAGRGRARTAGRGQRENTVGRGQEGTAGRGRTSGRPAIGGNKHPKSSAWGRTGGSARHQNTTRPANGKGRGRGPAYSRAAPAQPRQRHEFVPKKNKSPSSSATNNTSKEGPS